MNFRTTASFSGLNLAVATRIIQNANRLSVEQSAEVVLEEAEAIVPVGETGDLRDSGHVEIISSGIAASAAVVFDAPHAQFVEYGTGLIGKGTYPYDLPTAGVPITGNWIYDYKKQNWQGHAAQPYLRPSLDLSRPAIVEIFRDNMAIAVKTLGK